MSMNSTAKCAHALNVCALGDENAVVVQPAGRRLSILKDAGGIVTKVRHEFMVALRCRQARGQFSDSAWSVGWLPPCRSERRRPNLLS